MIVKKHFAKPKTTSTKAKKRLVSGANGKSVTDLDEFALTAIKKRKTADRKLANNSTKKKNKTQEQSAPSNTNSYNVTETITINTTPAVAHNGPLPPITYMLPSNNPTLISPLQSNFTSYVPLQNFTSRPSAQCQLCFNFIKPLEVTSNCNQCHGILCWDCGCKIDKTYQFCHFCRSYYTNQQQTYFSTSQH